jgi:hypothetical protein
MINFNKNGGVYMHGHRMQVLFVKGEVTACAVNDDGKSHCLVNITNDGWHVCKQAFLAESKEDLDNQFYTYLNTDEFQSKLRPKQSV